MRIIEIGPKDIKIKILRYNDGTIPLPRAHFYSAKNINNWVTTKYYVLEWGVKEVLNTIETGEPYCDKTGV